MSKGVEKAAPFLLEKREKREKTDEIPFSFRLSSESLKHTEKSVDVWRNKQLVYQSVAKGRQNFVGTA